MSERTVEDTFLEARKVLDKFTGDDANYRAIEHAGDALVECFRNGNKAFSCGNGGSMCDAMHFAEEMTGRFREERRPFPVVAISDPAHITCTSNDYGFEQIFSRYVEAFGRKGDILFAISTSGNSRNVLNAVNTAKKKGMMVIGLTGKNGGELSHFADREVRAPYSDHSDRAQEIHIKVIHALVHYVERNIDKVD